MHYFLFGLAVGVLAGGALSYLYASTVITRYKAAAAIASQIKKAL
jgi:hypothetical protein